jgi:hypothetical protein
LVVPASASSATLAGDPPAMRRLKTSPPILYAID